MQEERYDFIITYRQKIYDGGESVFRCTYTAKTAEDACSALRKNNSAVTHIISVEKHLWRPF